MLKPTHWTIYVLSVICSKSTIFSCFNRMQITKKLYIYNDHIIYMNGENIFKRIRDIFGSVPENYNILEEQIDINLQMEYFDFSKKVKKELDIAEKIEARERLLDAGVDKEEKKRLLVQLASIEDISAYRLIERYVKEYDEGLRNWAILALQESRMLLQSRLLDENQVFISTGLGGKNAKLRYFVVLIAKENVDISTVQQQVIRNEFELMLKKYSSEVEEYSFFGPYATLMVIIPMDVPIKEMLGDAIQECNHYGNFLLKNFIVTNVKKLSFEEIRNFLAKHNLQEGE